MSDTVEKIKERLGIVDVVSGYVKLTRAGKYWKGLSPFTKEKTPSFFVSPDKGLYHCFSTGKGGDMFTFVEEMEGVDFKGALKILAEKAGVELRHESQETRDERQQLFDAVEAAAQFFEATLQRETRALEYLKGRGIDASTLAHWRVGYAPRDWHALKTHLVAKGLSETTLLSAGLIKRKDEEDGSQSEVRTYDRFRGRIMFPIFDASGRVIAFSGRIFEDDPAHPQAKYLNSPEGPLFDKSRALYGIQDAKTAMRTLGFCMLVEGQVDLLLSHQLGYRSAVATSGTSLTVSHIEVIKRYTTNVLLAYDGDQAGVNATYRAALLLLAANIQVKVVALPKGVDPADMALKDPSGFKDAIKHARPVIDFFVAHIKGSAANERSRVVETGKLVLPLVAMMGNALERAHAVRALSDVLGIPEASLLEELAKYAQKGVTSELSENVFFKNDARERLLFGILRTYEDAGAPEAGRVLETFTAEYGAPRLLELRARGESEEEAARILASENFFILHASPPEEARALETLLGERTKGSQLKDRYREVTRALKEAEAKGDVETTDRLMTELSDLSKKLE